MSNENIFDLSKKTQYQKVNNDKIEEELKNYDLVEIGNWDKIPRRSHIRYLRKDGNLPKGGYVKAIFKTNDNDNKESIKINLVNNFGSSAIEWNIYLTSIEKIWKKKPDLDITTTDNNSPEISELKEDMVLLKESLNHMKAEIQRISNEQIHTVRVIKKLHKLQ